MKITYLFHSGFLVELAEASLLFDWWKGALPPLRNVPLYCFASHHHPDHFNPQIFTLGGGREVYYILGSDIRLKQRDGFRWGLTRETAARCRCLRGGESASYPPSSSPTAPTCPKKRILPKIPPSSAPWTHWWR